MRKTVKHKFVRKLKICKIRSKTQNISAWDKNTYKLSMSVKHHIFAKLNLKSKKTSKACYIKTRIEENNFKISKTFEKIQNKLILT